MTKMYIIYCLGAMSLHVGYVFVCAMFDVPPYFGSAKITPL